MPSHYFPSHFSVLELKGRQIGVPAGLGNIASELDPPQLYVHSPSQHRQFFQFTRPKTFMIKKPVDGSSSSSSSSSSSEEDGKQIHSESPKKVSQERQQDQPQSPRSSLAAAVTFSESREVLDRLSAAFWPGPVAIYAPVKARRQSASDCSSLVGKKSDTADLHLAPILPQSILVQSREGNQTPYVGIRCPSHPLSRRILEEVYDKNSRGNSRAYSGDRRHFARSRVVVGFDASVPCKADSCPTNAREVCAQLLSSSHPSCLLPPKVHVLNGEDKREFFSHVTCEFGAEPSVSLVVDDENRTVRVLKRLRRDGTDTYPNVSPDNVSRALLKSSPLPLSPARKGAQQDHLALTAGGRVVAAVLQRWKVTEEMI